jgi:hypothetical protein
MISQLQNRILDWWYSWEALMKLVALVALCLWLGFMAGYYFGRHVGYVADLEDEEPAPYHSLMKGRK